MSISHQPLHVLWEKSLCSWRNSIKLSTSLYCHTCPAKPSVKLDWCLPSDSGVEILLTFFTSLIPQLNLSVNLNLLMLPSFSWQHNLELMDSKIWPWGFDFQESSVCCCVVGKCFNTNITVLQALVKLLYHECGKVMEMATAGCCLLGCSFFWYNL